MLLEPLDGQDEVLGPIQRTYTTRIDVFHRRLLPFYQPEFWPIDVWSPFFLYVTVLSFFSSLMIIGLFIADFLLICSLSRIILMSVRLSCALWELQFLELKRQLDSLQSPSQLATSRSPRGPLFWPFVLWFTQRHPSWTDNDRRFL